MSREEVGRRTGVGWIPFKRRPTKDRMVDSFSKTTEWKTVAVNLTRGRLWNVNRARRPTACGWEKESMSIVKQNQTEYRCFIPIVIALQVSSLSFVGFLGPGPSEREQSEETSDEERAPILSMKGGKGLKIEDRQSMNVEGREER
jgi:hypothetical protein